MNSFSGIGLKPAIIYRTPDKMEHKKIEQIIKAVNKEERIKKMQYEVLRLLEEKEELKIERDCSENRKEKRLVNKKIKRIQTKLKRIMEEEEKELFE